MSPAPTGRCFVAVAILAMAATSARASETIGAYTIVATPTSAALSSGGGAAFTWLNVANAPVSVNDAFTGFGVVDDGYANAASGTTLLLSFAPGMLVNHAGPDLVLFDADNNLNVYLVSISFDGFAHPIVAAATTDTGVNRNYFLGGTGPANYAVLATTIDLSSFGVPPGQAVDQVRLFTEGPSNDPLGLGVLAPPAEVPAGSAWGLAVTALVLAASAVVLHRRRATA